MAAWHAIFQDAQVSKDRGRVFYRIVYTDDSSKQLREYNVVGVVDDDALKATARAGINEFKVAETGLRITLRPGDEIDLTPPVPPEPTPEEVARAAWFEARRALRQYREALAEGWGDAGKNQAAVDALIAQLQADYLDTYRSEL